MNKNLLCEICELEYRVKHDADDELYPPKYCPFCGILLDGEEEYEVIGDEDIDE